MVSAARRGGRNLVEMAEKVDMGLCEGFTDSHSRNSNQVFFAEILLFVTAAHGEAEEW